MINPKEYYTPTRLKDTHPLLQMKNYHWFIKQIKTGRLKGYDTNPGGGLPRYFVLGQDLLDFVKELEGK